MINNSEFSKRLEKVIKYYDETASSFAEKVGVQRSSISHILSGRNKPSLDFVLKVLDAFPEVELYWLLNGKGHFPNTETPSEKKPEPTPTPIPESTPKTLESEKPISISENIAQSAFNNNKDIERIVIFFKDGTFKNFSN
ncbi:helix-turn-helix transcriptional regulator [Bizionia sp. KMM 8389]